MKIKTKQITVTAIMLAICLVSQFFKNLSVYITGPIINAALPYSMPEWHVALS